MGESGSGRGNGGAAGLAQQPQVKSVVVYRNGDPFYRGRRMLIHERKVGNFDVFLQEVTGSVHAPFGAVRNLYTPRAGHRITSLDDMQSGEVYVAGGGEGFKKLDYMQIGENKKKPVEINSQVKPVTHSRINVSARFRKPVQEPCTIFLIANGDMMNPASRLLIPRKTLSQWDHVLAMATEKISLRSGAVHRLYTLDGKLVRDGTELENGQFYVAVGRDKFKKLPYGDVLFSKSPVRRAYGSKASSLPPITGSRKHKENGHGRQTKSTGGSSDTGETLLSPQPPKRKDKIKQAETRENAVFSNKTIKVKQNIRITNSTYVLQDNDESVFKAVKKRSETWGAAEVQEDEETQVEVPVDQRTAETVEEEERDAEVQSAVEKQQDNELLESEDERELAMNENGIDEEQEQDGKESLLNNGMPYKNKKLRNFEDGDNEEGSLEKNEESGEESEAINGHHDLGQERTDDEDYDNAKGNPSHADSSHENRTSRLQGKLPSPRDSEKKEYAAVA
ncbi:doublecortin domain-containing protein 2 isoform X2 [Microcaecilia unicolor]|uniref:Doublecortin domain-containing protein 2 n=1 Tax=Microcaecilia unicolor TaxID=1415580 RepID=A0A6P7YRI1_9AMPH|nr:doublecortin domain-containing protein 2 isoform X2 [Microcaecilia unicolor]